MSSGLQSLLRRLCGRGLGAQARNKAQFLSAQNPAAYDTPFLSDRLGALQLRLLITGPEGHKKDPSDIFMQPLGATEGLEVVGAGAALRGFSDVPAPGAASHTRTVCASAAYFVGFTVFTARAEVG